MYHDDLQQHRQDLYPGMDLHLQKYIAEDRVDKRVLYLDPLRVVASGRSGAGEGGLDHVLVQNEAS